MTTNSDKKLMNLLANHFPETIILAKNLEDNGISRELQKYYLRSGWLESVGYGAFKRPHEKVQWKGALYAIQKQMQLPVHVGALTSLSLQGITHYVRLGEDSLYLFSPLNVKLPKWFRDYKWGVEVSHFKTNFLPSELALFELTIENMIVQVSSPERAILECLYLTPNHFDMVECYHIFEGLSNLRPKVLQELLEKCESIKVKRLFLYMADKTKHQWSEYINQATIALGKGDRILVKGGVYIAKHRLSIPRELAEL